MLKINTIAQFRKDIKKAKRQGRNLDDLRTVVDFLQKEIELPPQYRDHPLRKTNRFNECRDCHIQNDWVLIYRVNKEKNELDLVRLGTHSEVL